MRTPSRLLAVLGAAALPLALVGVAGAQSADNFTVAPTSGSAGTTITVTGTCAPPAESEDPFVEAFLVDPADDAVAGNDADLSPAGAFSLSFAVPAGARASQDYLVVVQCFGSEDDDEAFFEGAEDFTVTGTAAPSPAPKAPAKAVGQQPSYTG